MGGFSLLAQLGVLAAASILPFTGSLHGAFLYDDTNIVTHQVVTGAAPWTDAFTTDFWGLPMSSHFSHKSYRPLAILSFRATAMFVGTTDPFWYHVTNLVAHTLNSLLMFALSIQLVTSFSPPATTTTTTTTSTAGAFAAALLFALHPLHSETVASVTYRADLFSTSCVLLSLLAYLRCRGSSSVFWHGCALLLALSATLFKEQGVTVLGLFPVVEVLWWLLHSARTSTAPLTGVVTRISATVVFLIVLLTLRLKLNNGAPPGWSNEDNILVGEPLLLTRVLTFNYLMGLHMAWLIWPHPLCHDWNFRSLTAIYSLFDVRNLYGVMTWVAFLGLSWLGLFRLLSLFLRQYSSTPTSTSTSQETVTASPTTPTEPINPSPSTPLAIDAVILFSLALIILPFLPASNLFFPVGFTIAERIMYTSSCGFCLLVGLVFSMLWKHTGRLWRGFLLFSSLLVLAACAHKCWTRSNDFIDFESLLRADVISNPHNAKNWYSLGHQHHLREEWDDAEALYRKANSLQPHYPEPLLNLANVVIFGKKDHVEGEALYVELVDRMIESTPDFNVGDRNHVSLFSMVALELSSYAKHRGNTTGMEYYLDVAGKILSPVAVEVQDNAAVQMYADRLADTPGHLDEAEAWYDRLLQSPTLAVLKKVEALYKLGQIAEVRYIDQHDRGSVQIDEYLYTRQDVLMWYETALKYAIGTIHENGVRIRLSEFSKLSSSPDSVPTAAAGHSDSNGDSFTSFPGSAAAAAVTHDCEVLPDGSRQC